MSQEDPPACEYEVALAIALCSIRPSVDIGDLAVDANLLGSGKGNIYYFQSNSRKVEKTHRI